jgi:hypothetical protein
MGLTMIALNQSVILHASIMALVSPHIYVNVLLVGVAINVRLPHVHPQLYVVYMVYVRSISQIHVYVMKHGTKVRYATKVRQMYSQSS